MYTLLSLFMYAGTHLFDEAVYFDVALYKVGVDVAAEMACVSIFEYLDEYFGEFDFYVVQCQVVVTNLFVYYMLWDNK